MGKIKLSKEEIKKLKSIKEFRIKDISLKDIKIEPGRISILRVKGEGGMEGEGKKIHSVMPCACGCGKFILLKKRTHRFLDGACRIRYWRQRRRVVVAGPAKPGEIVRRLHRKVEGYIKEKKA